MGPSLGVDVAKATLAAVLWDQGQAHRLGRFPNQPAGFVAPAGASRRGLSSLPLKTGNGRMDDLQPRQPGRSKQRPWYLLKEQGRPPAPQRPRPRCVDRSPCPDQPPS